MVWTDSRIGFSYDRCELPDMRDRRETWDAMERKDDTEPRDFAD
jgi:hypothetical protein